MLLPASLTGIAIEPAESGLQAVAELTDGAAVADLDYAGFLLSLDLPYLDHLSIRDIKRLRREYEPELAVLRDAIRRLMHDIRASGLGSNQLTEEVRGHIAELRRSAKYARFQRDVLKMGGAIAVFSASLGALSQSVDNLAIPALGVAGVTAAGVALLELIKQSRDARAAMAENAFYPLWVFGLQHEQSVRITPYTKISVARSIRPSQIPLTYHWLCPPTSGCQIALVVDETSPRGVRPMSLHEWVALTKELESRHNDNSPEL